MSYMAKGLEGDSTFEGVQFAMSPGGTSYLSGVVQDAKGLSWARCTVTIESAQYDDETGDELIRSWPPFRRELWLSTSMVDEFREKWNR